MNHKLMISVVVEHEVINASVRHEVEETRTYFQMFLSFLSVSKQAHKGSMKLMQGLKQGKYIFV